MRFQEIRSTVRGLVRAPAFTLVTVATLAIGIGSAIAVGSFADALLLRPFPYVNPEALVLIQSIDPTYGTDPVSPSVPDYLDFRERARGFSQMASFVTLAYNLPGDGGQPAIPLQVNFVTSEFFSLLGIEASLGRVFTHPEEMPGDDLHSVVLSDALWRTRFGADPKVLGRTVLLDTTPYKVIGVAPPGFRFGYRFAANADAWAPLESWFARFGDTLRGGARDDRAYYSVVARLASGVSLDEARAELGSIARALESEHGGTNKEVRADLVSLRDAETKRLRPYAVLLAGAVGLVLLVACANVANLMLARASTREKELAVRAAFGAGRFRLLRLALLEASVLGLAGGIAGVLLSWGALRLLEQAVPVELPVWMAFRIDGRILAFGLLVTLAASLGFGIVPAREVLRSNLSESIRQGGRGGTARSAGLRRALITFEVGLALVLVAGAFQLLSGLLRLGRVDPGLTPEKLVVFYVSPPGDKYRRTERLPAYADLYRRVIDRVREVPGVAGVAGANAIPNDGEASEPTGIGLTLEGQTPEDQRRNPTAVMVRVSPGYFEVAGIPRLQGRDFRENEDLTAPLTAIVSASAARRFWPGQNPLGRRLKTGLPGDDAPWAEVIGVVGDVRYHGLDQSDDIAVYYSYNQRTAGDLHFAVRAQGSAEAILDTVRRTIAEVDPQVAVYNARTMGTVLANSTWRERLSSHVLGAYAASALALAAVGIYGVISYLVSRRAAEMGIRMAVGATRVDIVKLVQSEVAKLLLLGCVLGLAGAAVLTRAIEGLVFGAEALDLASFLLAPATVLAAGLAAGLLPALRASRTSPLRVLGWE